MSYPPANTKEWVKVLKRLGFEERRVGKGKHAYKFTHPKRKTSDYRIQRNFIIIPHKIYPVLSKRIVAEITFFGFTTREIEKAC
ncbi:hypothetical protein KKD62_03990 [Patescibacteria group bacterium]|nr:hypothetical protein [Patescibacteria group bacterium]MBU1931910.1 hypothetical protein [Patescibacteria group bacterium]